LTPMYSTLDDLYEAAGKLAHRVRVALVGAQETAALAAAVRTHRDGVVESVLVGVESEVREAAESGGIDLEGIRIADCRGPEDFMPVTMRLCADDEVDTLMKGGLSTRKVLRSVLDKQYGFAGKRVLSHVGAFEIKGHLTLVTDSGVNILPDFNRKLDIINNAVELAHALDIDCPKVALLAAVEKVRYQMPATSDAAILQLMSSRDEIKGCIVEGPLSLDMAMSRESARNKGVESRVAGSADILVCPSIETGNVFYKTLTTVMGKSAASIVVGAKAPIVVSSRSDGPDTKRYSLALCALMIAHDLQDGSAATGTL
jgi:phosphate butyryltransferase